MKKLRNRSVLLVLLTLTLTLTLNAQTSGGSGGGGGSTVPLSALPHVYVPAVQPRVIVKGVMLSEVHRFSLVGGTADLAFAEPLYEIQEIKAGQGVSGKITNVVLRMLVVEDNLEYGLNALITPVAGDSSVRVIKLQHVLPIKKGAEHALSIWARVSSDLQADATIVTLRSVKAHQAGTKAVQELLTEPNQVILPVLRYGVVVSRYRPFRDKYGDGVDILFWGTPGATYILQGTPDLSKPWENIFNGSIGTEGVVNRVFYTPLALSKQAFFRVKLLP